MDVRFQESRRRGKPSLLLTLTGNRRLLLAIFAVIQRAGPSKPTSELPTSSENAYSSRQFSNFVGEFRLKRDYAGCFPRLVWRLP
jgi:hypothetical protein